MYFMSQEKVTVSISRGIYEKAEEYIRKYGGFKSVDELVEFILNEVLSGEGEECTLSKEEEEAVKERLKSLGYL